MLRPLVRLLPIVFTLFSTLAAQQNSTPPVANSPKGFDQQYKKLLRAYEKEDEKEIRAQFQSFLIPKHWFTDTFGPDLGPKLADQYWELFLSFESETTAEFQSVAYVGATGRSAELQTRVWRSDKASPPAQQSHPQQSSRFLRYSSFRFDINRVHQSITTTRRLRLVVGRAQLLRSCPLGAARRICGWIPSFTSKEDSGFSAETHTPSGTYALRPGRVPAVTSFNE
jgi:hypothetical protein